MGSDNSLAKSQLTLQILTWQRVPRSWRDRQTSSHRCNIKLSADIVGPGAMSQPQSFVYLLASPVPPGPSLPTMYNLPSEDPGGSGLPDDFHDLQPELLGDTFQLPTYPWDRVFTGSDLKSGFPQKHNNRSNRHNSGQIAWLSSCDDWGLIQKKIIALASEDKRDLPQLITHSNDGTVTDDPIH